MTPNACVFQNFNGVIQMLAFPDSVCFRLLLPVHLIVALSVHLIVALSVQLLLLVPALHPL